jgi:hypothetical protein
MYQKPQENGQHLLMDDTAGWTRIYDDGKLERPDSPMEAHQLAAALAPYGLPQNGLTVHAILIDFEALNS